MNSEIDKVKEFMKDFKELLQKHKATIRATIPYCEEPADISVEFEGNSIELIFEDGFIEAEEIPE